MYHLRQSQPFITTGMMHLSETSAPELKLKAYHARLMITFLTVCCKAQLDEACRGPGGHNADPELVLCFVTCAALSNWHLQLERLPRYLTAAEGCEIYRMGMSFLRPYKLLAQRHVASGSLLFPLKPRHHTYLEACNQMRQWRYNLRFRHCFRDEDALGQTKSIVRKVHRNLLEVRTLSRLALRFKEAPPDRQ